MFASDDTIVAIATPPGRGGIGVVRISGPDAAAIAAALTTRSTPLIPRMATFCRLRSGAVADPIGDEVVATLFPNPQSYTGQDVVEISAHGSPVVLAAIVRDAVASGARLAEPGEFTLRAFLNGKRDLIQAEAVGDLIDAATPLQARTAFDQLDGTLTKRIAALDAVLFDVIARLEASLDFPDEGYHFIAPPEVAAATTGLVSGLDTLLADAARGRLIRDGATVVIAGRPNVGKSSLFNALCGSGRAIVADVPGTTRDLVTERVDIEGLAMTLVDTAGAHETTDSIEREGVSRAAGARDVADLVLVVVDGSVSATAEDDDLLCRVPPGRRMVVVNKIDRPAQLDTSSWLAASDHDTVVEVSATTGHGLDRLRRALIQALTGSESLRDTVAVSNARHAGLMGEARALIAHARDAAALQTPEEFLLTDLQAARACFDEIVGRRTTDDVLRHIFERFCIGK